MSIETRTSRLVKKTGVEKSRWTVPLRSKVYIISDLSMYLNPKPGEVYMYLITASCILGSGTMHMCILEICICGLQILEFADRRVFHNSVFDLSKCQLYIEIIKYLKQPCQESNQHPLNSQWSISVLKVSLIWIKPSTFWSNSSSLHHYTMVFSYKGLNLTKYT
jgi:hypothetical protein